MEVIGYKCFNKDMTNSYGMKFEEGKTYIAEGEIIFGTRGNGYHMAERLEDTLKFFYADEEEVNICLVKGSGNIVSSFDQVYDYYDMYSVEKLSIIKKLTREEIINYGLNLHQERVKRFIAGFKLTEEEIILFKNKFSYSDEVLSFIEYYQEKKYDAFHNRMKRLKRIIRK